MTTVQTRPNAALPADKAGEGGASVREDAGGPHVPLATTALLPEGFHVPASRWTRPSTRMRELLRTEPYLFGPGVYDPMGAQLARNCPKTRSHSAKKRLGKP